MTLTKRQKELLEYITGIIREKGFPPTLSEMAKALKVSSKNAIAKLLRALEEQGFLKRDGTARGLRVFDAFQNEIQAGAIAVPILGSIPAGGPIVVEQHVEDWVNLPQSLLRGRQDVFLLKVRGDSMEGAGILNRDLVIVKPTREVRSGDIVVTLLHDEATVKRFVDIRGKKYLKPENPKYKNIYPQGDWTVQGKVVGVIRNLE